jgi:XRE family aerobic/anaerobic benzoate catabolism transcriptional regulator
MTLSDHETHLLQAIGERVRALRTEQGIPARAVAESAHLSLRFYRQLETGQANISVGRLARVARVLQVPLEHLVAAPEAQADRSIALLGLRGAGKSTLGPQIAQYIDRPFVELDERIEQAVGLRISEIFELHGEPYYRRLETRTLTELLQSDQVVVVALSGGIVQNEPAFQLIRERCTSIWLQATPDDHMARVRAQGDHRPMRDRADAMAELKTLLAARAPLYGRSDLTVNTSAQSLTETLGHTLRILGRDGAGMTGPEVARYHS